jgi:hypothetical protein
MTEQGERLSELTGRQHGQTDNQNANKSNVKIYIYGNSNQPSRPSLMRIPSDSKIDFETYIQACP